MLCHFWRNCLTPCGTSMVIIRQLQNMQLKYLHYSQHFPAIIALKSTSIVKERWKICEHQSYVLIYCHFRVFLRQAGSGKNHLQRWGRLQKIWWCLWIHFFMKKSNARKFITKWANLQLYKMTHSTFNTCPSHLCPHQLAFYHFKRYCCQKIRMI